MKEILFGLLTIIGFCAGVYLLIFLCGTFYIFFSNILNKNEPYIEHIIYTRQNITSQGIKGLIILGTAMTFLLLCFLIGAAITGKI